MEKPSKRWRKTDDRHTELSLKWCGKFRKELSYVTKWCE